MRQNRGRPTEERRRKEKKKKKNAKSRFLTSRGAYINLRYYSDFIHLFDWKSAVEHDGRI